MTHPPSAIPVPPEGEPEPVVKVALATFQGMRYLERQVRSILAQQGVQVQLIVSDDGSTDGTREWLEELASTDPRVTVLPPRKGARGVGPNFLHALQHLNVEPGEYAAFADQDDVWWPGKLANQVEFLRRKNADAVSSNVIAFSHANGKLEKELIRKDQTQTKWDFIFEAPSAGSTFLFSSSAWNEIVDYLDVWGARGISLHDWFSYAIVRASGGTWWIDPRPHVAYRQHASNALGAHKGLQAIRNRYRKLRSGHYRNQFLLTATAARRAGARAGQPEEWLRDLDSLINALESPSMRGRLQIARRWREIRRRPLDQLSLAASCMLGIW